MKVKSFFAGILNNWDVALEYLDQQVTKELGTEIEIHNVIDTYDKESMMLRRVVVYSELKDS